MKLMYISDGAMGLFDGVKTQSVSSKRVEQFARTLRQLEEQHAWKSEGEGAKFMKQSNPYANAAERQRGVVTGLAFHGGKLLYAVDLAHETGGIYKKDPLNPDAPEGLVTSAVGFRAQDLTFAGDKLYAALDEGLESHIMQLDPVSGQYSVLTAGDTRERHPFLSKDGGALYFDMCGFARDENQNYCGKGPSAIAMLNMRTGDISEAFSSSDTEYLKYTEAKDGSCRMLVRPYRQPKASSNPAGCLFAPFSAIMGFVHFFSAVNAVRKGKEPPLQTAANEAAKQMDRPLIVDGVSIDPKQLAAEQKRHPEEHPGLIPRDWRLVRIHDDGTQETLQHGVLDYLPLDDGGYLYSNGAHVFRVTSTGQRTVLFKAHLATALTLLED